MSFAFVFLAAVCVFVWAAPPELTKTLLAGAWLLMAIAAVVLQLLSFFRLI